MVMGIERAPWRHHRSYGRPTQPAERGLAGAPPEGQTSPMIATKAPTAGATSEAWIAGATGLVGRTLLELLLDRSDLQRVTSIVRRPTGHTHAKLLELVID